jgi:hypothetical protein
VRLRGKVGRRTKSLTRTATVENGSWKVSLKLPASTRWTATVSFAGSPQVQAATLHGKVRLKVRPSS